MRHANVMANQMRLQALLAAGQIARPRIGLVTSYDPNKYAAKVTIQPEGFETGWLPITVMMAGQGWGVYFGPNNGDQCAVSFQEGDREVGFITGFFASDSDRPPIVQSGEMHFIHKGGAFLKFLADGGIHSSGAWTHTGDLTASGTVTGQTDVLAGSGAISGKGHKHTGVQTGAGTSGAPTN